MNQKIFAAVGLDYTGLPQALEFGKNFTTVGYDLSERKAVPMSSAGSIYQ